VHAATAVTMARSKMRLFRFRGASHYQLPSIVCCFEWRNSSVFQITTWKGCMDEECELAHSRRDVMAVTCSLKAREIVSCPQLEEV
jgi:hypothetical protein